MCTLKTHDCLPMLAYNDMQKFDERSGIRYGFHEPPWATPFGLPRWHLANWLNHRCGGIAWYSCLQWWLLIGNCIFMQFPPYLSYPGWWFGTWSLFFHIYIWECHHPSWRTHIFQRGRYTRSTTNQYLTLTMKAWDDDIPKKNMVGGIPTPKN